MTRVSDSDQRANSLIAVWTTQDLCGCDGNVTRRPSVTRVQSLLQLLKNAPRNQIPSLFYAVQAHMNKKSEDAATRLRCTQSLYMSSFVQARVSVIYHLNGCRALFECASPPPLTRSDQAECHLPCLQHFLHFVARRSKPVATLVATFWKKDLPVAAIPSLLAAYFGLLQDALATPGTTPDAFTSYSITVLLGGFSVMKLYPVVVLLRDPALLCSLLRAIDTIERRGSELLTNLDLQTAHESISLLISFLVGLR